MKVDLDARGLLCPLPVIRTQDRARNLQIGDRLEVTGTDPGILHDIPAWARVHGHRVLEQHKAGIEYVVAIEICRVG